jgi:hypothetical protein
MLDINKLNNDELRLAAALSQATSKIDKYMVLLYFVYGLSLTKKELAEVLKKSSVTIERRIKEGTNVPEYIKSSEGNNSSYIFPIFEVALHLSNTIKIA